MSANTERREATKAYKERKISRGLFAVRCPTANQVWVGFSLNLDATRNGLWFGLRCGTHLDKPLQAAWNERGEQAFEYEVLEVLDDDVSPIAIRDVLKAKRTDWAARVGARVLL